MRDAREEEVRERTLFSLFCAFVRSFDSVEREREERQPTQERTKPRDDDEEGELKSRFVKIKRTHRIESMHVSMYKSRACARVKVVSPIGMREREKSAAWARTSLSSI